MSSTLRTGPLALRSQSCWSRYHVLNIKDRALGTQVSELLEQVEETVVGNRERFYRS